MRAISVLSKVLLGAATAFLLAACSSGSTDVTTGSTGTTAEATGPTATAATGPLTGATGDTGTSIAGTWTGTWASDQFEVSGTFEMTFQERANGFTGTIQIDGSNCVSSGEVEAAVDGNTITIGAVQAEQEIEFEGQIAADGMSGTYHSPAGCGDDTGTWEAARSD